MSHNRNDALLGIVLENGNSTGMSARIIITIQHVVRQRPPRFFRQKFQFNSGNRIIRKTESDRLIDIMVIREMLKKIHPFLFAHTPV